MGFFDPPNIGLRKRLPAHLHPRFNRIEKRAQSRLSGERSQSQPYQLGIVLALWIKAGELMNEFQLPSGDSRRVQSIYESCMKVAKDESSAAFGVLRELAVDDLIFGVPEEFYIRLIFGMGPTEDMILTLADRRRK